ncbi:MAG: hypothetical protein ACLP8S_31565 [Solirubrobacteraceae bacterium]
MASRRVFLTVAVAPRGWEALWAKDVWRHSELPHGDLACSYSGEVLLHDSFLTDGSFRAVHEQQRATTRRLLSAAWKKDNLRLVEVLDRDEQSLARILDGLDAIETNHPDREELARLREEHALAHGRVRELELHRPSRRT